MSDEEKARLIGCAALPSIVVIAYVVCWLFGIGDLGGRDTPTLFSHLAIFWFLATGGWWTFSKMVSP